MSSISLQLSHHQVRDCDCSRHRSLAAPSGLALLDQIIELVRSALGRATSRSSRTCAEAVKALEITVGALGISMDVDRKLGNARQYAALGEFGAAMFELRQVRRKLAPDVPT
jgi:hypothetical protein